jgi:hypothetical protein
MDGKNVLEMHQQEYIHKILGGYQNSLKLFRPDLDRNKLGLNLV